MTLTPADLDRPALVHAGRRVRSRRAGAATATATSRACTARRVGAGWRARRRRPCGRRGRGSRAAGRSAGPNWPIRGLCGFPNHGSMRMILSPGVRTSMQAWPYQVMVVSRSRAMRGHLRGRCYNAATLDPVSATQIGQNLAFVNWTVLTGLALGTYAAIVLLRRRTSATPGYLRFAAICALGFGVLAWISDGALPAALADSPVVVDPAWDAPRGAALGLFTVLVARRASWPAGRVRGSGVVVEAGAVVAAVATLVFGALALGRRVARGGRAARPAGGRQRGDRRGLRGDDPRPLVSRDAEAAGGAAHPARPRPARRRRGPGRAVRGLDRDRRRTGRRRAVLVARRAVGAVRLAAPDRRADLPARSSAGRRSRPRGRGRWNRRPGLLYINVGSIAAGTILAAGLYFGAGLLV